MDIKRTKLQDFMLFEDLDVSWAKNINIIFGENSTGKTTILKALYSLTKPITINGFTSMTKDQQEQAFVQKMLGVFRPDDMHIGRLSRRKRGMSSAQCLVEFENNASVDFSFNSKKTNHAEYHIKGAMSEPFDSVFLPTKEMISSTEHFATLYEGYQLDFEETYYDLVKLLDRPLSKGPNTSDQNKVLESMEEMIHGKVVQKNKKFYLWESGSGEFEMGLVSEGYRKISILLYLLLSGSLTKDTILFWDEPETNLNPKMIRPLVQTLIELAKIGVQMFVSTHDYFVLQEFSLLNVYPKMNPDHLDLQFYSLHKSAETEGVYIEQGRDISELKNNAIMKEFDSLYDREQDLIYGTK